MASYHNIARSAFRDGYLGWDGQGCRYRIRRDGPRGKSGSWWVYPDMPGCIPVFYAPTLRLVSRRLELRDAVCGGTAR